MNFELSEVSNGKEANDIINFLLGPNTYHFKLSDGEKKSIKQSLLSSLVKSSLTPRYWFFQNEVKEIIGAGGIHVLQDTKGGYFLGWLAVHKDYRKNGLGKRLVEQVEKYARLIGGRFITIDTGLDNSANFFYQKIGYKKVAEIPEYFEDLINKVVYYKKLS